MTTPSLASLLKQACEYADEIGYYPKPLIEQMIECVEVLEQVAERSGAECKQLDRLRSLIAKERA